MLLIIDGYNVLKQAFGPRVAEREKQIFIKKLIRYVHEKKHTAIVVFDGGSFFYRTQEHHGALTVVYVGIQQSADDYIQEILAQRGKELLLVSSDNELCSYAQRYGIVSLESLAFFQVLFEKKQERLTIKMHANIQKLTLRKNPELDEIMEQGSRKIPLKQEEYVPSRVRGNRYKKHEKFLLKKIKKL